MHTLPTCPRACVVLFATFLLTAGAGGVARQGLAAESLLDQTDEPPAARSSGRVDLFGDPLPEEAVSRLGTTRFRHAGNVLGFTRDGKALISAGYDAIRLWDPATGKELRRFAGERNLNPLRHAALSPDGTRIATIDSAYIGVWNLATGKVTNSFGTGNLKGVAFSPDGKVVLGLAQDSVELYDLPYGRNRRSWKPHETQVGGAVFTPDSKTLITGGDDKAIRFWDVATGKKLREITGSPLGFAHLALSPDGSLLATVGASPDAKRGPGYWLRENRIRVWDVPSGKEVRQVELPATENTWLAPLGFGMVSFSPDGKTLLSAGPDQHVHIWEAATGKKLRQLGPVGGVPSSVAFSPDEKTLAVDAGNTLRLIDLASGKDLRQFSGHEMSVYSTALSPDGRTAVTAGEDRVIYLWDSETGRIRNRLEGHGRSPFGMRLLHDGRTLYSVGSDDKALRAWDPIAGKELWRLELKFPFWFGLLALSSDGKTLAVSGPDNAILFLDAATGKELRRLKGPEMDVTGGAWLDGDTLALWCIDHTVHLWDAATGRQRHEYTFPQRDGAPRAKPVGGGSKGYLRYEAATSPDGRLIAYGTQSYYLALLELATGKVVQRLDKLPHYVLTVAFSADSKTLAWGNPRNGAIRLVEVEGGQERHRLEGHAGGTYSITISADGRTLISGNSDTTALVWDLTGRLAAKENWGRKLTAAELDALWLDLASANAARGFKAVRALAGSPAEAVPFLRARLPAATALDEKRLDRLLADLDSNKFDTREAATTELERLGEAAVPAYQKLLASNPSAEVRRRVEDLLDK